MEIHYYLIVVLVALCAGFVNAVAGGGTLLTFPTLLAIGIPPVVANVTNTLALVPGVLGGLWAQRAEFKPQYKRILKLLLLSIPGGLLGGYLLLYTNEEAFSKLVPFLILGATTTLLFQNHIKKWLSGRNTNWHASKVRVFSTAALILLAAIYGGYFGAGLGVILMAVLGLSFNDSLSSINVLKQAIGFAVNIAASIFFIFSGKIIYSIAVPMLFAAVLGGYIGGRFVSKVNPNILRWIILVVGFSAGIYFLYATFFRV